MKKPGPPNRVIPWILDHVDYMGDECLKWPFAVNGEGRPQAGNSRRPINPVRYMCELAHGPSPEGRYHAAHSCGKGHESCINPRHLSWKTPKENIADKVEHGTASALWGSSHPLSKLKEADIPSIRDQYKNGVKIRQIASNYAVDPSVISRIVHGLIWKHV